MRTRRFAAALLLAAAISPAVPALRAEEPVPPPKPAAPAASAASVADDAKARKEKKVIKYFELSRWDEGVLAGMDAAFEQQQNMGVLPPNFGERFRKAADMKALKAIAVEVFAELYDEPTLDGLIVFFETDAGKKYAEANLKLVGLIQEKITPWAMETVGKVMADGEEEPMEAAPAAVEKMANETAALATLRNLASAQAQIQASGKIDGDDDGIGEYGTFLEMTGSVGVRKGQDFSSQGKPVVPPILSKALTAVGPDGVVKKSGYCFRIVLPDTEKQSGFVHETGPAEKVGLAGGTGKVGVDMSEINWCAYAWPEKIDDSGRRAFFVNQAGDVMQSSNEKAQWAGEKAPPGNSAFRGAGISSYVAVGTAGRDGDVWKVTN